MFMRPWKNRTTVTLAAMVLLLGLGLVTRTLAAKQPEPASAEAASVLAAQEEMGDFFRDFRAQRETARADEIALLDEIVHREGAPEESVREADARRIELTRQTEQERAIETQLVAKGFEDAAAFVQEGTVTIVVKRDRLSDEDTAQILEIAMRQTEQEAGNVKIIPVAG